METSFVDPTLQREPKTEAEAALRKELLTFFEVYEFTRPDRVSLVRSIIAALDAAEKINK